jgi:hypothetical protein
MDTSDFVGDVKEISVASIRPSTHNPRGEVEKDDSFERLVSSIDKVGLLVPIVVTKLRSRRGAVKYELVDGERRYWAAKSLGKSSVPAHVLHPNYSVRDLRRLMFHLHMTREQWKPLAQCRSLAEAYPPLDHGLKFREKPEWVKKLIRETGMQPNTARDRVHVLAWPKQLKQEIYDFDDRQPKKDIYSYVLAIEASIVEPSLRAFPDYYNHNHVPEAKARIVRGALLQKTTDGFVTGAMQSREQIREITPLFLPSLPSPQKRVAQSLFNDFVRTEEKQFDDLRSEIAVRLPEVVQEKAPPPRRLISSIEALTQTIERYELTHLENSVPKEQTRSRVRRDFQNALRQLAISAKRLDQRLDG